MKLSIRLKAAWRAFKNPYHSGVIGFCLPGNPRWGFVGTPIIGDAVDPKEIMLPNSRGWVGAKRRFTAR